MAEVQAVRRRRARGEEGDQHRAVRARADEAETGLTDWKLHYSATRRDFSSLKLLSGWFFAGFSA